MFTDADCTSKSDADAYPVGYAYCDADCYSDGNTYSYRFSKSNTQVTPDAASASDGAAVIAGIVISDR
jgi:hypothetical protein